MLGIGRQILVADWPIAAALPMPTAPGPTAQQLSQRVPVVPVGEQCHDHEGRHDGERSRVVRGGVRDFLGGNELNCNT